ncbi:hypothetical protein N8388_04015 [Octadecabacter sp.]|nr:hypothetical protein [Octadecabacter sp.]MDC1500391.1 hypothetical protein [Octadecabacter sp.]
MTQPFSVADVLTPAGTAAARRHAATDRAKRDQCALGTRPMLDDAHHQAGLVGTSLVDPVTQPADPRLIAKFGSNLCLKHRVLPW